MIKSIKIITGERNTTGEELLHKAISLGYDKNNIIAFPETKPKWMHSLNLQEGLSDQLDSKDGEICILTYSYTVFDTVTKYKAKNKIRLKIQLVNNEHKINDIKSIDELYGKVFVRSIL